MKRIISGVWFLGFVGLVWTLTSLAASEAGEHRVTFTLIFALGMGSAFLMAVFGHEAAHALVGIVIGLRPTQLHIWPFAIEFNGVRRPRYRPHRMSNTGWVRFDASPYSDQELRWRWIAMRGAGPVFNLLFVLIIGGIPFVFPEHMTAHTVMLLYGMVAMGCIYLALTVKPSNIAVLRTDALSDGKVVLDLLSSARRQSMMNVIRIWSVGVLPIQPKHYPGECIDRLVDIVRMRTEELSLAPFTDLGNDEAANTKRFDQRPPEDLVLAAMVLLEYGVDVDDPLPAIELVGPVVAAPWTDRGVRPESLHPLDFLFANVLILVGGRTDFAIELLKNVPRRSPFRRFNAAHCLSAEAAILAAQGDVLEAHKTLQSAERRPDTARADNGGAFTAKKLLALTRAYVDAKLTETHLQRETGAGSRFSGAIPEPVIP